MRYAIPGYLSFQGGMGKIKGAEAWSEGQTSSSLPFCHWAISLRYFP